MATVKVKGLDKLLKQFDKFGEDAKAAASAELKDGADDIAGTSRKNAPANLGELRRSIQPEKVSDLRWEIIAHAPYAGYVEFGTGTKVYVPSDMKDIAQAIKNNPKGDAKDGLESIKDYCRQKGILEEAAYPIFMKILKAGIRPQPYMYPAWIQGGAKLNKKLTEALNKEVNKFNSAR